MGLTEQLKPRTICWDESIKPAKTREELEVSRTETRKQRSLRLSYLIGDKTGISPYAKQNQANLVPDVKEIRPISRQNSYHKHKIQGSFAKAFTLLCLNPQLAKCPQLNGNGSVETKEKNQSCLFCRMESPTGGLHTTWCRKFLSMTEIYSKCPSTVSSRMKQRKNPNCGVQDPTIFLAKPYLRDLSFLPRRAGPSPTTPPPPTPPPMSTLTDSPTEKKGEKSVYMNRDRHCKSPLTKSQVVEWKFAEHSNGADDLSFLPSIDHHVTESSLFKSHLATKHKEITVSPAIGKEFVVEKLGLKLRMPHLNENWSNTNRKKTVENKPFLGKVGCTLPPMLFKAPINKYLKESLAREKQQHEKHEENLPSQDFTSLTTDSDRILSQSLSELSISENVSNDIVTGSTSPK